MGFKFNPCKRSFSLVVRSTSTNKFIMYKSKETIVVAFVGRLVFLFCFGCVCVCFHRYDREPEKGLDLK